MNSTSEQIIILYKQGHSPTQIADLLTLAVDDVLMILNAAGMLNKKNIERNEKAKEIRQQRQHQQERRNELRDDIIEQDPITTVFDDDEVSVEDIFKKHHKKIAQNLVTIAMSEPDDVITAGVIAKVGIYINEEVTGRNEARAKRNNQSMLLNVAEMLTHAKLAQERINNIVGGNDAKQLPSNVIEVAQLS